MTHRRFFELSNFYNNNNNNNILNRLQKMYSNEILRKVAPWTYEKHGLPTDCPSCGCFKITRPWLTYDGLATTHVMCDSCDKRFVVKDVKDKTLQEAPVKAKKAAAPKKSKPKKGSIDWDAAFARKKVDLKALTEPHLINMYNKYVPDVLREHFPDSSVLPDHFKWVTASMMMDVHTPMVDRYADAFARMEAVDAMEAWRTARVARELFSRMDKQAKQAKKEVEAEARQTTKKAKTK